MRSENLFGSSDTPLIGFPATDLSNPFEPDQTVGLSSAIISGIGGPSIDRVPNTEAELFNSKLAAKLALPGGMNGWGRTSAGLAERFLACSSDTLESEVGNFWEFLKAPPAPDFSDIEGIDYTTFSLDRAQFTIRIALLNTLQIIAGKANAPWDTSYQKARTVLDQMRVSLLDSTNLSLPGIQNARQSIAEYGKIFLTAISPEIHSRASLHHQRDGGYMPFNVAAMSLKSTLGLLEQLVVDAIRCPQPGGAAQICRLLQGLVEVTDRYVPEHLGILVPPQVSPVGTWVEGIRRSRLAIAAADPALNALLFDS